MFEKRDFKGNQHNKTSSSNVEETPTLLSTNTTDDIPSCSLNNSGDLVIHQHYLLVQENYVLVLLMKHLPLKIKMKIETNHLMRAIIF